MENLYSRKDIKSEAKSKLVGNWGTAGALIFIQLLILILFELIFNNADMFENTGVYLLYIFLSMIIGGATDILNTDYFMDVSYKGIGNINKSVKTMFKLLLKGILITVLIGFIVGLGTFLLFIPGIIFATKYMFSIYVLIDNPDIGVIDALRKSDEITSGHKMDLFVFQLSFVLWTFTIPLTFGLSIFYVVPYMAVATAVYYNRLTGK